MPLDTIISLISLIRFLFTMINDDAERKQEKFAAASCVDMAASAPAADRTYESRLYLRRRKSGGKKERNC